VFASYFEAGGPVMWVIFAAWVIVLAGVLDRLLFALDPGRRKEMRRIVELVAAGGKQAGLVRLELERRQAEAGLGRIEAVSQLATSLGLFGTVLGIARSFFARGGDLGLAAPEVLSSGLATALFTTIAGLMVFLFGQAFLIGWREWRTNLEGRLQRVLDEAPA